MFNKEQLMIIKETLQYALNQATDSRISIVVDDADDDVQYVQQQEMINSALEAVCDAVASK